MPLTVKRPGRWTLRALLPWAVGTMPILCGLLIMHLQAERELQARSQDTAGQVVAQVERILDNISAAAQALLPLAGSPCDEKKLALRDQVTRRSFVRSTNLVYRDELYCSSLFGPYSEPVNTSDYVDGKLWLMNGNSVTPGHPLLVYRVSDGDRGAISTVDGDHLLTALHLIGPHTQLSLQVGRFWMDKDGIVREGLAPAAAVAAVQLTSQRYPFAIHSGYGADKVGQVMRDEYPALFGLLVFLGVIAGAVCRWLLRRASSPRAELQRAMEANEFLPYFQPVVRKGDYRWAGAEVLIRWQHPRDGLVRPDLFIPYAEHSGQIVPMTRMLMRRTAELLAPHAALMDEGFHVGINITADHCQDMALYDDCRTFLAAFPPGRVLLTLELTERKLIVPTEITQALFAKLHALGVMIAIDDFGTGQSSLSYLRQFKVDYLKIDQSFVALIGVDALSLHILDSIIELSAKLELGIVAEGVENPTQRDYLARHGVDFQQGYLFGRPMPIDSFVEALAAQVEPRAQRVEVAG
ncbi:EAL domain-containing protein [Pseudomonas rubra]|uniref:cyclic-guanylate-specific phosphodiesterase n=1 Tax=Pseudomonas rubra TaxID=2942627 RepID=A0ABT5PDQ2_9PSED|nr:EAL domain-containing protein [Pseudomonas rubra]MDD1016437.1 EAL domain-containing protein [Pseudomonas rubra]MDD1036566.1 EAL domain-containing protein [Pseudomonas rubra]MDD1156522.1 EAL domain-containing protein [Pseudomonas rubra]